MEKSEIVPEIISVVPKEVCSVTYPNGVTVDLGNVVKPSKVKKAPQIKWNIEDGTFYTVCMIDPDAPSRSNPKAREWRHWLVGNVPGYDIGKGELLTAYAGSTPPKGTGLHRYVFLVYKQSKKLKFSESNAGEKRGGFSIQKFAEKYQLGDPIAGNYYQAEWENAS